MTDTDHLCDQSPEREVFVENDACNERMRQWSNEDKHLSLPLNIVFISGIPDPTAFDWNALEIH